MFRRRTKRTGPIRLAVVHNNVDQTTSIGKLASWSVRTALDAGMDVTVVARDLDESLRSSVDWRPLYVPPRIHALQWAVARKTIQRALRGCEVDLIHVYQPQVAALADTWHVEYLSRVAVEAGGAAPGNSPGERSHRLQQLAVARMEDFYLRRLGEHPTVLFCSELVERHFSRLYGRPPRSAVLHNPAPPLVDNAPALRTAARRRQGLPDDSFVVGFLGGIDHRKGYRTACAAAAGIPGAFLAMAGPSSEGYVDHDLGSRLRIMGMLRDLSDFWASIDVLAVPSTFDPFAMVVTEAAAHGIPSVVSPQVGVADKVRELGAGVVSELNDFGSGLRAVLARRAEFSRGARALAMDLTASGQSERLLMHWRARLT